MFELADVQARQRRGTAPSVREVPEYEPREHAAHLPETTSATGGGTAPRPVARACTRASRSRPRPAGAVRPINRILPSQPELGQFLQWMIEVLDGRRAVTPLRARLDPALVARLRCHAPRSPRAGRPPYVLLHHALSMPTAETMEVWGAVRRGRYGRVCALVARIEQHDLAWRATAFQLVDNAG